VTNLVLVRHGETVWHAENRYAGRSDVALTARGHEQAERLAEWARDAELDAVWCSPLSRARETAATAAGADEALAPRIDPRLRELDFGDAEGLTVAEMEERFPAALQAFREDPVAHHLPGGEDPRAAVTRALACFRDIASRYPGGRVLVVTHTTLKRLALCRLVGMPLAAYRSVFPFVRNCAITEVRLDGDRASILEYNTPLDPTTAPILKAAAGRDRARR
jgi:probable phosphoglycerate mutase